MLFMLLPFLGFEWSEKLFSVCFFPNIFFCFSEEMRLCPKFPNMESSLWETNNKISDFLMRLFPQDFGFCFHRIIFAIVPSMCVSLSKNCQKSNSLVLISVVCSLVTTQTLMQLLMSIQYLVRCFNCHIGNT